MKRCGQCVRPIGRWEGRSTESGGQEQAIGLCAPDAVYSLSTTNVSTTSCLQDQSPARQTAAGRADQTFFWNQALVKPVMEAGAHRWGAGWAEPGGKPFLWNNVLPLDTVEHSLHLSPWCQDCQSFGRRPQSMVVGADGGDSALTQLWLMPASHTP